MSSESEWSCRVEGSGSQCNVLKQPNHQTVLVRERQDRQKERKKEENKRMRPNAEDGQKVSHIRDVKDGKDSKQRGRKTERERRRTECGLIEKRQRAGEKGKEET